MPLQSPVDAFLDAFLDDLDEVDQTLAPATCRAYRSPLALYLLYLRQTLNRPPELSDFTIETARARSARAMLERLPPRAANAGTPTR